MNPAKRSLPVAVLVVLLLLAGCGNSSDTSESSKKAESAGVPTIAADKWQSETDKAEVEVDTRDNSFSPQYVEVSVGTEITFDNKGRNPHNVVAVDKGAFETVPVDDLQPGDKVVRKFDKPGEYPYYCSLHGTAKAGMNGRIKVVSD